VGLAQAVGAPLVVVHLPFRFPIITGHLHAHRPRRFFLPLPLPRREPYYHFLHDGQLAALEAEQGIVVAVENMPSKRFLGLTYSPYRFNSRAELARFPHLTLDTTHLGTWGIDPAAFYEHLRDRVAHVHLSNFDGREHRSPPDGALALGKLLRLLARDGYRGAVTVECGPAALDACDEDACLDALRRALAFCREHYAFDDNV
jgi:sugar phosphate isomerase/epimerase